jgi:hypothetical protein
MIGRATGKVGKFWLVRGDLGTPLGLPGYIYVVCRFASGGSEGPRVRGSESPSERERER